MYSNDELTEVDEKPSIALSLIVGHGHDTRHVILLLTRFFLLRTLFPKSVKLAAGLHNEKLKMDN